jgi:glutamate--cysteine ligase
LSEPSRPIASVDDLVDYFRAGETPVGDWAIGTEHEKIGVYTKTGERVPYEGERGIGVLLERIAERDDWKPVYEGPHLIALAKGGATITLEPGGQIELSGAPLRTIRETCREFNGHVDLVNEISAEFGISFLALGVDPFHAVPEIPIMPKHRYEIMRSYLPTRGKLALDMMHASATVQANYDFANEQDMRQKMQTAMGCTAIVSAIFANSCISSGEENGFISRRVEIWRDTDPDRCGILHFVFEPDFGYRDYAEWAVDVPMFFVLREGRYIPARGTTFRQFMEHGFDGHVAAEEDWNIHLTTLFPEVRLKQIIEVRGADAVPRDLICALPALWKGVLYDDEACGAAWSLVADFSPQLRDQAQADVARLGLGARIGDLPVLELARELLAISSAGLARIGARDGIEGDERSFLEPVEAVLELGKSPGEVVLEGWRGGWRAEPERLIDYARY